MPSHFVVIDGLALPAALAGDPALDFCNTRAGWHEHDQRKEYLRGYDHLAVWAGANGLLPASRVEQLRRDGRRDRAEAETALHQAHAAREDLYAVLAGRPVAEAFGRLSDRIRAATATLSLQPGEHGPTWVIGPEAGLAAPALAVLWAAGQLLVSPERALITVCPGHDCGWLFLNRSGRRRWCTMATCGNRAKVKRFAQRHRGDAR